MTKKCKFGMALLGYRKVTILYSYNSVSKLYPLYLYCRHIQPVSGLVVKLDLQLYQIDLKNYLLDFKCVNPSEEELTLTMQQQADQDPESTPQHTRHFLMEFFEICSRLITSLAQ